MIVTPFAQVSPCAGFIIMITVLCMKNLHCQKYCMILPYFIMRFLQVLASLRTVRNNFGALTNLQQDRASNK